jgi:hypothetical protein
VTLSIGRRAPKTPSVRTIRYYRIAMKVIGIEFAASEMNYVVVDCGVDNSLAVTASNRLNLSETRSHEALRAFQQAVKTLLKDVSPDYIAIKTKPEKGSMAAGPAALKMEAIVLASAPCEVKFISGARINKCVESDSSLKAYHHPAFKAAVCGCKSE